MRSTGMLRALLRASGMPKFWGHSELTEFVEGIGSKTKTSTGSSCVTFVRLLSGKKSGKSFGVAELDVNDKEVAEILTKITFEAGDYREGLTFTFVSDEVAESRKKKADAASSSYRRMLDTLDLDQYLMSPDVLYDSSKLHQRKYLTKSEPIEIDAFLSEKAKSRAAICNEDVGRGSPSNIPLPKPYVR